MVSNRVGTILLCSALAACGTSAESEETSSSDSSAALSALQSKLRTPGIKSVVRERAFQAAAHAGVNAPKSLRGVAALDHQEAENVISGAVINDHAPVYVFQMTGGPFVVPHHPPNAEPPHGNFLTVTFDATTLEVTDVGYDDVAPKLAKINPEVVDLLEP